MRESSLSHGGHHVETFYPVHVFRYGLALMVEILCGVMSGGAWGPHIRQWGRADSPGGLSHSFIVLDPAVCGQHFSSHLQHLLDTFRALDPADPELPVHLISGPILITERSCLTARYLTYQETFGSLLTCPGDLNSNGDRRDQGNLNQYKLLQLSEEVELQRV